MRRYYGHLTGRLDRLGDLLHIGVVAFSSGAFVALLSQFPEWVPSAATALAAASGALQSFRKYPEKALHSAEIFRQLGRQLIEWERLWAGVYDKDDAEVRTAWEELIGRQVAIVERAPRLVTLSRSLARRTERESNRYWTEQYASA